VGQRVGSFRYLRAEDQWEWSDAVAQMHGYVPGQVQPSTALVMSHKHPDDAANVGRLIEAMTGQGRPFSSRHRIVDTRGRVHPVIVIGERLCDDGGNVIGSQGLYVDLSDVEDGATVEDAIAEFTAHRAVIEQAKGVLMMTYSISAERAFDILCGGRRRPTPSCGGGISDRRRLHRPAPGPGRYPRARRPPAADRTPTGARRGAKAVRVAQRRMLTA
jgi:hypothetical protein